MNTQQAGVQGFAPIVRIGPGNPEAMKYRKLYEGEAYRRLSPGEQYVPTFLEQVRPRAGSSVIDFGAGTGRPALALALFGQLNVTMVDFVGNCLDDDVRNMLVAQAHALRFVQADLETGPLPIGQYGFCFPAGTVIAGSGDAIDGLSTGKTVVNRDGRRQEIRKTFERLYTGDMVRLRVACVPDVLATAEHPILVCSMRRIHRRSTYGGRKSRYEWVPSEPVWRAAAEVRSGDWVIVPRVAESESGDLRFRLGGGGRGRRATTQFVEHTIDDGAAWLLGLYVAEGHTSGGRITLSLNAKEGDLAVRAVREFRRLGVVARPVRSPSIAAQNGMHVDANCVGLAALLDEWCGHGAASKRVPPAITYATAPIVRSFLLGLVDGDGCLRRDPCTKRLYYSVTTVSRQLAFDVLTLLHKLGIHASLGNPSRPSRSHIQGRAINGREAYCVQWAKRAWDGEFDAVGRPPYGAARFIDGKVYLPIKRVTYEPVVDLPVFNIHTDDETYGVPFTVHNCADVMEHIPPDKVGAVLDNILAAARHAFFAISTTEDTAGHLIGETLHLSIHPYAWWLDQFKQRQCVIHWSDERNTTAFFHVSQWMSDEEFAALPSALTVEDEQAIAQVRENTAPAKGWSQVRPHVTNDHEVMILGGGPSLGDHVEEIRGLRMAGVKLVTLNGTYNWALEHGLIPSAQIVVDARAFNARFVQPVVEDCKYLMASQVHPDVLADLPKDRTWLWHTGSPLIKDILDEHYGGIWWPIPGGSTVLFRAIPLLRLLGFRRFHLFGCDSCLRDGDHHAYGQSENDDSPILLVMLDLDGCPVEVTDGAEAGRVFYCHPSHVRQATEMMQLIRAMGDEIELAIYGDGLLAHILKTGAALNDGHSGRPDHGRIQEG